MFKKGTHIETKRVEYGFTNRNPQKQNHLNVCIGASRVTNSSMGTHIKMKRVEYGFTNGNPQKNKII